jgi:ATP-dependent DNA helicase RecG
MIAIEKLIALLQDVESDSTERTISTNKTDKFGEAICAFANDLPNHSAPGYLLIGVTNDGKPSGLKVTDQLLSDLGGIKSDGNLLPQPAMNVTKFMLDGGDIAVVEVFPSDLPPVRYKGTVWVRTGPRRGRANEQEERILTERRIAKARSFDALPCTEANIDDLALGQFDSYRRQAVDKETIDSNNRSVELQLASLRLFDLGRKCPTNCGILLFGQNPRYFFPGAYVQYLSMPGANLTDLPNDSAEISGNLQAIIKEIELRIKLFNTTQLSRIAMLEEQSVSDYPEWALRELFLNAIIHRNYESNSPIRFYVFRTHIEIQSPGGLYGEATPKNFPKYNSYRNPIIAEVMKSLGFVNRFGYGVQRAQQLLVNNQNPPAEFEFDDHAISVKIFRRRM